MDDTDDIYRCSSLRGIFHFVRFNYARLYSPRKKDGAFVCNSGHFDVEINLKDLKSLAKKVDTGVRPNVDAYHVGPKKIYVLAEGRLVNLAAAEGHPASVMDMSFATQALASEWLSAQGRSASGGANLASGVYEVPDEIEAMVAKTKLASMGLSVDRLTPEQRKYLSSWQEGT